MNEDQIWDFADKIYEARIEQIIRGNARKIAEEIAFLFPDQYKEIYYDPDTEKISFSKPLSEKELMERPDVIGIISGINTTPIDWEIEWCDECGLYHRYDPDTKIFDHESDAILEVIDLLEDDIFDNPRLWVIIVSEESE